MNKQQLKILQTMNNKGYQTLRDITKYQTTKFFKEFKPLIQQEYIKEISRKELLKRKRGIINNEINTSNLRIHKGNFYKITIKGKKELFLQKYMVTFIYYLLHNNK